ncbi:MAG: alpha/beta hydrolase [Asgard group archaeon]|nr:alpha/beta hydrolase [Asgard group archaeon]
MDIIAISLLIVSLVIFYIFIFFSRSFFGVWLTEVGLLISGLPIAIIIASAVYISRYAFDLDERLNVILFVVCIILDFAVLLRVFIPFFYIRRTNRMLHETMEENLGTDYLQYIDPFIESSYIKNVRFQFKQYFVGIRKRIYSKTVEKIKNVVYKEVEGKELKLDIYKPRRDGKFPIIIFIHGGGFVVGSKDNRKNERLGYMLADLGYTVLSVDYRLTPLKYLTSKKANLKEDLLICNMVADIRDAILYAQIHANEIKGNPMELFLFGRSAGGHLALLTAVSCFGKFYGLDSTIDGKVIEYKILGVVAFYAVTDFTSLFNYYGKQNLAQLIMDRSVGGTPDTIQYYYSAFSPITYVTEKNRNSIPPVFLATGGKDRMVSPEQSRSLYDRLQAIDIQSVLLDLPWANHAFDNIISGPGGQLVLKYLSQFLVWVITQNKLKMIDEMALEQGLGDIVSREKFEIIQKLRDYEISEVNDIHEFLEKLDIQYAKS